VWVWCPCSGYAPATLCVSVAVAVWPTRAVLLDFTVAVFNLDGTRSDGTMIILGGIGLLFTTFLPRIKTHAFAYCLHLSLGLAAPSLGSESDLKLGRISNFIAVMLVNLAVAYRNERRRREIHLLVWYLHRSRLAERKAGAWVPRRMSEILRHRFGGVHHHVVLSLLF
jgi:hypothetical protein